MRLGGAVGGGGEAMGYQGQGVLGDGAQVQGEEAGRPGRRLGRAGCGARALAMMPGRMRRSSARNDATP